MKERVRERQKVVGGKVSIAGKYIIILMNNKLQFFVISLGGT